MTFYQKVTLLMYQRTESLVTDDKGNILLTMYQNQPVQLPEEGIEMCLGKEENGMWVQIKDKVYRPFPLLKEEALSELEYSTLRDKAENYRDALNEFD